MSTWAVTQRGVKHDLTLTDAEVVLSGPQGWRIRRDGIVSLAHPTAFSVRITAADGSIVDLGFSGDPEVRRFRRELEDGAGASPPPPPMPATQPTGLVPRATSPHAGLTIGGWIAIGVGILVVAGLIVGISISNLGGEYDYYTEEYEESSGAIAGLVIGYVVAAAGSIVLSIGVIAKGVQVGMRSLGR